MAKPTTTMKHITILISLLICICCNAQIPQGIRVTGYCNASEEWQRVRFFNRTASDKCDPDAPEPLYFLKQANYFEHFFRGSFTREKCFIYYFDPNRQAPEQVQADVAIMRHFFLPEAHSFPITHLDAAFLRWETVPARVRAVSGRADWPVK